MVCVQEHMFSSVAVVVAGFVALLPLIRWVLLETVQLPACGTWCHVMQLCLLWHAFWELDVCSVIASELHSLSWTHCSWWNSPIPAANRANSRYQIVRIPATPISPHAKLEIEPPTQTYDSQFWFSQFMKCNFFNLVVATPDAMADSPLRSLIAHQSAKATNS